VAVVEKAADVLVGEVVSGCVAEYVCMLDGFVDQVVDHEFQ
jgi:hypothetical protein